MRFVRDNQAAATRAIADTILDGLRTHKRVLWLVSGGSNIAIEKEAMDLIREHAGDRISGLAILPIDERYGQPGHADSNSQALREAGFDPGGATWIDVLMHNLPLEETVSFYTSVAGAALSNASLIVGQFGMGSDGHIAGIKPDSPAVEPDASTVTGYKWDDYIRMTLMPEALKQITSGFLIAYGADKKKPLTRLQNNKVAFKKFPAVLLYDLPNVSVYNDQIESEGTKKK